MSNPPDPVMQDMVNTLNREISRATWTLLTDEELLASYRRLDEFLDRLGSCPYASDYDYDADDCTCDIEGQYAAWLLEARDELHKRGLVEP